MVDVAQRVTAVRRAPLSWRDRILSWRDGLLSNPRFQRFAGSFALTRPIARRRASALFDLCAGFVYSQVLQACVQLNLSETLARGPLGVDDLAARLSLPPESMRLLCDAAVSLQLVQKRSGDRYGLGPLGAALLGNPGVVAMIRHHQMLYQDLTDPLALLRHEAKAGQLARYWPYAGTPVPAELNSDVVSPYTALMAQSQPMISAELLHAYSFAGHRRLLDVGGGNGAFLSAVAQKYPQLQGVLFDLPAVAEQARARFRDEGLTSRASAVGGSFLSDPLPEGADIISLVRILHDHDDDHVMTLLRAAFAALPPGGSLLVAEPLSGTRGSEAIADAYFAVYLLAMGSGRPRSFDRLRGMLTQAGFTEIALKPAGMPMLTRVITARKMSGQVDTNHVNKS
jgi:demethylspheroidene O-methyltransferase